MSSPKSKPRSKVDLKVAGCFTDTLKLVMAGIVRLTFEALHV